MSGYSRNAVYSYVADAITAVHQNVDCTSRRIPVPETFPSCYIHEVDVYRPLENIQLDFQDKQWESTFEIQVISNKKGTAASEAYAIMDAAKSAMNRLFYRQLSETPIDGTETFTLITRFRRQIGGGDTMPQS